MQLLLGFSIFWNVFGRSLSLSQSCMLELRVFCLFELSPPKDACFLHISTFLKTLAGFTPKHAKNMQQTCNFCWVFLFLKCFWPILQPFPKLHVEVACFLRVWIVISQSCMLLARLIIGCFVFTRGNWQPNNWGCTRQGTCNASWVLLKPFPIVSLLVCMYVCMYVCM